MQNSIFLCVCILTNTIIIATWSDPILAFLCIAFLRLVTENHLFTQAWQNAMYAPLHVYIIILYCEPAFTLSSYLLSIVIIVCDHLFCSYRGFSKNWRWTVCHIKGCSSVFQWCRSWASSWVSPTSKALVFRGKFGICKHLQCKAYPAYQTLYHINQLKKVWYFLSLDIMALVRPNLKLQHHDQLLSIVTVIAIVFTRMNNHELSFNNYITNDIVV